LGHDEGTSGHSGRHVMLGGGLQLHTVWVGLGQAARHNGKLWRRGGGVTGEEERQRETAAGRLGGARVAGSRQPTRWQQTLLDKEQGPGGWE